MTDRADPDTLPILPTPVECAGALCVRVVGGTPEILLIRRGQPPRAGEWSIPGGRIEPGERVEAAVLRELTEETGVRAGLGPLVEIIETRFDGTAYRLHDYLCLWQGGDARAADDALEARWFTSDEVADLGMWPKTLEVVERALTLAPSIAGQPEGELRV